MILLFLFFPLVSLSCYLRVPRELGVHVGGVARSSTFPVAHWKGALGLVGRLSLGSRGLLPPAAVELGTQLGVTVHHLCFFSPFFFLSSPFLLYFIAFRLTFACVSVSRKIKCVDFLSPPRSLSVEKRTRTRIPQFVRAAPAGTHILGWFM